MVKMSRHLFRIAFLLIVVQAWTTLGDPTFPKMSEIFEEFYQAEVMLSDENQDGSSLAVEYYDKVENRGRLDVTVYGNKLSIFYYNLTGDILEVNSTSCKVSTAELSDYFYAELFFGWLYKYPLIIGPSALLWFAQDATPDYIDQVDVRGIKCNHFTLTTDSTYEKMTYDYYFAVDGWTTPYQTAGKKVPVRITVAGESSRESGKKNQVVAFNQVVDYSYFSPTIEDTMLQPAIGLGCVDRKSDFVMPSIPKEFRYASEVYDLLKAENSADTSATFMRVWFSTISKLARIDNYEEDSYTQNVVDFNTGVIYSMSDSISCKIIPLRNVMFEEDDGLGGFMKKPAEAIGLYGDFYFMGFRTVRGINCRVFESARKNAYYGTDQYHLLVTTVFFTEEFTKVVVEGEDLDNIPVLIQVTAYDKPNNVAIKVQHNIFAFDNVIGPTLFNGFPIEDCFPLSSQKAYFIVNFYTDDEIGRKLEGNDHLFLDSLKSEIQNATGVSDIRIPYMKAEYTPGGTYVMGLMIDRPPMLKQFWKFFYGPAKAAGVKRIDLANTPEKCAFACVDEKEFLCRGFHFCSGFCYINKNRLSDEMLISDTQELGICDVHVRADLNSTTKDPYLIKALEALRNAQFIVKINLGDLTIELPIDKIIVGDGPYRKNVTETSYNVVYSGYQLPDAADVTTVVNLPDVSSETECYTSCKDNTGMSCQSFSYCPEASSGNCRISSEYITENSKNVLSFIENNKLCNVYSLLSLELFEPYPGKVLRIQGEDSYSNITAEECAHKCKKATKFTCRGFEYCSNARSCVLHSKHVIDVKDGDIISTDMKCTHYAAKFSADYLDMGPTLIDDDSNVRNSLNFEECARVCSEEVVDCNSFNYCPESLVAGVKSSCALTSKTLLSRNVKTTEKEGCHSYARRDSVESYSRRRRRPRPGISGANFTGLVIGMVVFGLLVGVAMFVGFSYYRSRKYSDGLSVKFVNQPSS